MRTRALYIIVWLTAVLTARLIAAPPYIPLGDRVRESRVVIVAEILKYPKTRAGQTKPYTLSLSVRTKEVLKGKAPRKFSLPVRIEPRGYGNFLPEPPPPGKYILFLIRGKSTKSPDGVRKPGPLLPYAPQNFFYIFYNAKNMRHVTLHLLK